MSAASNKARREIRLAPKDDPLVVYETRAEPGASAETLVRYVEGGLCFWLPGVGHSDALLRAVAQIREQALADGERTGRLDAQSEFRRAIGIAVDPDQLAERVQSLEDR